MNYLNIQSNKEYTSHDACSYARRSSANQAGNNSFDMQIEFIKSKAMKLGLDLKESAMFVDDGVSAFNKGALDRQGLQALKRFILIHNIKVLIVYDPSRLDRTVYSFKLYFYDPIIKEIPDFKIYLTDEEEPWNPNELRIKVQLLLSSVESDDKRRRAYDAQHMQIKSQKRPGSKVPFGYLQTEQKLKINTDEANIVVLIYYLSIWVYSRDEVAQLLNHAAIPPVRGSRWNKSTIDYILKNRVYLGELRWRLQNEEKFISHHEPIITDNLYKLYLLSQSIKSEIKVFNTPFLLQDLLVCSTCNNKMKGENRSTKKANGKKYEYDDYSCKQCGYKISLLPLHETVIQKCEELLTQLSYSNAEYVRSYVKKMTKLIPRVIDKKLTYLRQLVEQLDFYSSMEKTSVNEERVQALQYVIAKENDEIETIKQRFQTIIDFDDEDTIVKVVSHVSKLSFNKFSRSEQKFLLHLLIKEIRYSPQMNKEGIYLTFRLSTFFKCKV